jgi:hypothetical protein
MTMHNITVFNAVALSATCASPWIETHGARSFNAHLSWIGTGTPVGAFTVEFSEDELVAKERMTNVAPLSTAARRVDVTSSIAAGAILGTGFTVAGGTNGDTIVGIENPPRFVRFVYTKSSGGSAASLLNGWVQLGGC